jgi:hypothetical protein
VFSKANSPRDWAITQGALSHSLELQEEWEQAVDAAEKFLEVFPDDSTELARVEFIHQEILFNFATAFEINLRRLKIDKSPLTRLQFLEKHLTTARFSDCIAQSLNFESDGLLAGGVLVRDVLRLTCEYGAGQLTGARQTANVILRETPKLSQPIWEGRGVRHFLDRHPAFAAGRDLWVKLFDKLAEGDGSGLTTVIQQLEETFHE